MTPGFSALMASIKGFIRAMSTDGYLFVLSYPIPFEIDAALAAVEAEVGARAAESRARELARSSRARLEEFGWRGFMLPLLQRRMAPLWASLRSRSTKPPMALANSIMKPTATTTAG